MESVTLPYGQTVELRQVVHETGAPLLRVVIRDGSRYQTLDLDPATAHRWGRSMTDWAQDAARRAGVGE